MGESRCSIGCADGYFPSTPPAACVDTGIPSAWQTAGYADCAAMAASFGCGFDGTVGGVAVPLGPVGTVLSDICTVTCGACPVAAAPMDDDTWCANFIYRVRLHFVTRAAVAQDPGPALRAKRGGALRFLERGPRRHAGALRALR